MHGEGIVILTHVFSDENPHIFYTHSHDAEIKLGVSSCYRVLLAPLNFCMLCHVYVLLSDQYMSVSDPDICIK